MMVRRMCGVSLKDRKHDDELLSRLGIECVRACDSSLVLMISFCTGVAIMARYQLLNNNNNNNLSRTRSREQGWDGLGMLSGRKRTIG